MTIVSSEDKPLNCTIVGASHAGTTLALQLRREGWSGPIRLIGAEAELPYHRPPLSKEFLAGDKELDGMRLRPLKMYQDNDIELVLGTSVLSINAEARRLQLNDGEALHYDRRRSPVTRDSRRLSCSTTVTVMPSRAMTAATSRPI